MDKEYIRIVLTPQDNRSDDRLIKVGDLIDSDLLTILLSARISDIPKAFKVYPSASTYPKEIQYRIELKCPECGKTHIKGVVSKTNAISIIKDLARKETSRSMLCDDCCSRLKEKEQIDNANYQKRVEEERKYYIENYLNPERKFCDNVSAKEKINSIMYKYSHDLEIKNTILLMDYYDFLRTPYWDGVRNYKLKKAGYCCQLCGGKGILNVHHKTYENHGMEHVGKIADSDLIVLCKNCHEKFHDKLDNKEVTA